MTNAKKMASLALVLAALTASSCRSRTYLLVTVEAAPELQAEITELQFVSSLVVGGEEIDGDERRFAEEGPLSFPSSFVLLADKRGRADERAHVFVEAYGADGATVARGRSSSELVAGKETSIRITLRPHCSNVDDCLGGQPFCENPHACNCEGEDCARGFCEVIDLDDGNSCTETICNEAERTATHEALADGTSCTTSEGEQLQCAQGICKSPNCGDFIVDVGEQCDEGIFSNSDIDPLSCRNDCRLPSCGDGVLDTGVAFGRVYDEQCDDGADNIVIDDDEIAADGEPDERCRQVVTLDNGTGETLYCRAPFCGDGRLNGAERCDDHNSAAGDACNPTCTLFGEVTTVAGAPGGAGHHDGVGEEARLGDVLDFALDDDFAYFTADGLPGHDHTIRRVSLATGEVETLAGAGSGRVDGDAEEARFSRPTGIAILGDSLYVADTGNHSVRRLDLATYQVETIAGSGSSGTTDGDFDTAQFTQPTLIVARSATELLVLDDETCRIRQIDLQAQEVTTVAGSSCIPFGDNFVNVRGMAMGDEPSLFVADENAIREVDLSDGTATTVAGNVGTPGFVDGAAADARFDQPSRLVRDGAELLIADLGNDVLRRLDLAAAEVSTIAPTPAIEQPRALALAGETFLVGDEVNHVIWEGFLDGPTSLSVSPLAGIESPASEEIIARPFGVTMVPEVPDALFVAETGGRTVQRVSLVDGEVSELVDLEGSTSSIVALAATDNRLLVSASEEIFELTLSPSGEVDDQTSHELPGTAPSGLAILGAHVYVTDSTDQLILRAPLSSIADIEIVAGSGGGTAIVDGRIEEARFIAPAGAVACAGNLYVSETASGGLGSHVVREVDVNAGVVTTIAGFPTTRGHRDASDYAERSLFDIPRALACDDRDPARPILFVADEANHVIRQIELDSGRVSTLAGIPGKAVSLDGQGSEASFSSPRSLYFDPVSGDLYISDLAEGLIRRIR